MTHALVLEAALFAARRHRDQRRKGEGQTPYINHPLRVADLLCRVGGVEDPEVLAAGLLHDTLEDTDTEPAEIAARFGERVRDMVLEVSDDKGLSVRERKAAQIAQAPSLSRGAALVKIADKIANIEDIVDAPPRGWSVARRRDYLDWAEAVVTACPETHPALVDLFQETVDRCRSALLALGDET